MDQNRDQANESEMNINGFPESMQENILENLQVDNLEDMHADFNDEFDAIARFPTDEDLEFPILASELNEIPFEQVDATENLIPDELLWQARTGLTSDSLCGAIETIIFMSDKPVSIQKIRALIDEDMPLKVIHESLQRLQA